jgi:cytoskeletal protein CcmA (bactofilin family)
MSDLRIRTIDEGNLETVIAEDVHFEGEMTLTDPILIKGKVSGSVKSGSNVYVSEQAELDTEIDAPLVSIKGRVSGDIRARNRLELFKTGSLTGKVSTPDLIIQSGSLFNGSCEMSRREEAEESGDRGGQDDQGL